MASDKKIETLLARSARSSQTARPSIKRSVSGLGACAGQSTQGAWPSAVRKR